MLETYLAIHEVAFVISLVIGFIFMIGILLGMVDTPHYDADLDASHGAFSVLGIGRCPVVILLTTLTFTFGSVGMLVNRLLAFVIDPMPLFGIVSFVVATVSAVTLTVFVGRNVSRYLPATETKSVVLDDMVGATGRLILDTTDTMGLGMFTHQGDLFQLQARSSGDLLPANTRVLVIEYDADQKVCIVVKDPTVN